MYLMVKFAPKLADSWSMYPCVSKVSALNWFMFPRKHTKLNAPLETTGQLILGEKSLIQGLKRKKSLLYLSLISQPLCILAST